MELDAVPEAQLARELAGKEGARYACLLYTSSLHELGKILHDHGFKVCEVSGRVATPGVFFGNESPRTIILAEKR